MAKYQLLGLGNALLDFQVEVPFEFLEEQGLKKGSMTLVTEAQQRKLMESVLKKFGANTLRQTSGGCSANTLAGFANFGGKGAFIGKVGKDPHGSIYERSLTEANIESALKTSVDAPTGTCIALITPDAERTMVTHLGISVQLGVGDCNWKMVEDSDIVHIEGYLWDSPSAREASLKAIEIARSKGNKVSFTYSDSWCVDRHRVDFLELTRNKLDIVFANEAEALKATGTEKADEAFRIMRDWVPTLCMTLGSRGAYLSDKLTGTAEHIPTWNVAVVDKLGAGDLFAAGFLYGWTHEKNLRQSGFLGCYAATKVIQQVSARLDDDLSKNIDIAVEGPTADEQVAV